MTHVKWSSSFENQTLTQRNENLLYLLVLDSLISVWIHFSLFLCFFLAYSSALKWYNLWCRFWSFLFDIFELIFSNKIIFNERKGLETGDHKINLRVFCLSLHRRAYDDVVSYFANFGETYWRISVGSRLSCVYNLVVYYLTDFMSY